MASDGNIGLELGDILLLEDNPIIAMDTDEALRGMGARSVSIAYSIAEATDLVGKRRYDLAILDYKLPDGTAETIADRLSADGVAIIFATGHGETTALQARYPGCRIVTKPFSSDDILKTD